MKKNALIWILGLFLIIVSCEEKDNESNKKCITGVDSNMERVFIRCATREEFMAGNNVKKGGTANWENYEGHKWESCSNCK